MATVAAPEHAGIGPRVKALREAMGLSLRDLAERTGVSAPMLSQVERGETSPTLSVAGRIAGGLELSLSQLLRLDEGEGVSVVRSSERRTRRLEATTPTRSSPRRSPGQRAEVSVHTLKPKASTGGPGDPPMHEAGSRETAVVTHGAVTLSVAGQEYRLEEGDSVTFDADLPHHFENPDPGRRRAS